jgi:hypothetical protein
VLAAAGQDFITPPLIMLGAVVVDWDGKII